MKYSLMLLNINQLVSVTKFLQLHIKAKGALCTNTEGTNWAPKVRKVPQWAGDVLCVHPFF